MRLAWSIAIIGTILTFWIGLGPAGLSFGQALDCLIASAVAGLSAVLLTLKLQRMTGLPKALVRGLPRSYIFGFGSYFLLFFILCKPARDFHTFVLMFVPVVADLGYSVIVFGPLQDQIIRGLQRKS